MNERASSEVICFHFKISIEFSNQMQFPHFLPTDLVYSAKNIKLSFAQNSIIQPTRKYPFTFNGNYVEIVFRIHSI